MTFSAIYAKIGFVCSHYTQYIKEDKIMNSKDNRSSFSGKIGFVLSAAGASVGLGKHLEIPHILLLNTAGESSFSFTLC